MLKKTGFEIPISGEAAAYISEGAKLAFDAVNEAYRGCGTRDTRGVIICQLTTRGTGLVLRGQFLPRDYAERIGAILTEYRDAAMAQDKKHEPIELQLSED